MRVEAVLTAEADSTSNEHLLQHYKRDTPKKICALLCGIPLQISCAVLR